MSAGSGEGYVEGSNYLYAYVPELNPLHAQLQLLAAGVAVPRMATACELGFGQGVTANMFAAASPVRWFGTDFNAAQAATAQEMGAVSGANPGFSDQSFSEFCARPDLPDFDFIGLHGIWTWVSDENRSIIVDFIRRKLRPGGVVYVSYNALPGSVAMLPMRDVLMGYAAMAAPGHDIVTKARASLDFAERLLASGSQSSLTNPQIAEQIRMLKKDNTSYIVHEYFGREWNPMSFSRAFEWLSAAKLDYACSARYIDSVEPANLEAAQQAIVQEIPDAVLRETTRDLLMNRKFRRDYWVKGLRRLSAAEQAQALRRQRIVLSRVRSDVPLKISGALREIAFPPVICDPILDCLADHRPKTVAQIEETVAPHGLAFPQIRDCLYALLDTYSLSCAQDDATAAAARPKTDRLNAYLRDKAAKFLQEKAGGSFPFILASPVTGAAVRVDRLQQLFIDAMLQGRQQPQDIARQVMPLLQSAGMTVVDQGAPLTTSSDEQLLTVLTTRAATFVRDLLPMLRALQIL